MRPEPSSLFDAADIDLAIDQLILEDHDVPTAEQTTSRPSGIRYDRAFAPAVREGYLTAHEAVQRGDREAYITRLEFRFDFPRDLAQRIADGRMKLRAAVDECERRQAATQVGRSINWRRIVVVLALITVASGFFGALRLASQRQISRNLEDAALPRPVAETPASEPPAGSPATPPRGRVERDTDGWVTRIIAAHPAEALFTFCASATPGAGCSTLNVVEYEPRFPGRRLGRFTLDTDGRTWLVPIRRDNGSGRWAIGTGLRPIAPTAEAPLEKGQALIWPYVPEFVPAEE